jgi:uncharacterized protein
MSAAHRPTSVVGPSGASPGRVRSRTRCFCYAAHMRTDQNPGRYVMDTASGVRLDLDDPRPKDIRIEDVAGGLSRVCRMGAQAREFYSVAQHALLVCRLVEESGRADLALVALHHDSHEAYLCDVPKPLKRKISAATDAYDATCDALDAAIAGAFGFSWPEASSADRAEIKLADRKALSMEATRLLPDGGEALRRDHGFAGREFEGLPALDAPLSPAEAEESFLKRHEELAGRTRGSAP